MNFRRLAAASGLVLAIVALVVTVVGYLNHIRHGFVPQTDTIVFTRDIRVDHGVALNKNNIVSTDHVPVSQIFSKENMARWGADTVDPDGVGLKLTFLVTNGAEKVKEFTLEIPEWEHEENNPQRRALVADKQREFDKLVQEFVAPFDINFTFAAVVDTTEGVSDALKQKVGDTMAAVVGDLADGKSTVYAYQLHELAYQGSRQTITPKSSDDLTNKLDLFLSGKEAEAGQSSVLRGVQTVISDLNRVRAGEPIRVDIWTDGLENTDRVSVYSMPSLLDPAGDGWQKLDGVWNPSTLDLHGLEVHLHPLPPKSQWYEDMMEGGLAYLADRLRTAGATVTIEVI